MLLPLSPRQWSGWGLNLNWIVDFFSVDLFLTLCKWGGQGNSGVHSNFGVQLMRTVIHKMKDFMEVARCTCVLL